ncbi:MAG: triose-phosphate isomerase [Xanthobacteraceae bacterium]
MAVHPLVAGNWKMNGLRAASSELVKIVEASRTLAAKVELMVCPPATLLAQFSTLVQGSPVVIGAQDCHAETAGAFTGDLSAEMLKDTGAQAIIVGHSERRSHHHETDVQVRAKALAAWRAQMTAIVCVGETKDERAAGRTLDVVGGQLKGSLPDGASGGNTVIAYEPVWAIGTGLTPTPADVAEVHGFIRRSVGERFGPAGQGMRILYGGSVKPSNAGELMHVANVDGALVGGASLKAEDFLGIAHAYA